MQMGAFRLIPIVRSGFPWSGPARGRGLLPNIQVRFTQAAALTRLAELSILHCHTVIIVTLFA